MAGRHLVRWADHIDSDGLDLTPLHRAAYEGLIDEVQKLIDTGADVNMPDARGFIPLHDAAINNHVDIVRLLIAAGAHINTQDTEDQFTPLHDAALADNHAIVKLLITAGADTALRTRNGDTATDIIQHRSTISC